MTKILPNLALEVIILIKKWIKSTKFIKKILSVLVYHLLSCNICIIELFVFKNI